MKVRLSASEIQKVDDIAGRTIKVQYFNIEDDSLAVLAPGRTRSGEESFVALNDQLWLDQKIPEKTVTWRTDEDPRIKKAWLSDNIKKGSFAGPLKIEDNQYILLKIRDWMDKPVITNEQQFQRWNEVKNTLTTRKALQNYEKFVLSIMNGKILDFNRQTLNKLVQIIGPMYVRSPEDERELFLNASFDKSMENPELKNLVDRINAIND